VSAGPVARAAARTRAIVITTASGCVTGVLVGRTATAVSGNRMAPWIVGRAAGLTAYVLLLGVTLSGLLLAHPRRSRIHRPSALTRIRVHMTITVAALAVTVLHVVVLATDRYAGVGWAGALLPLGSHYRPVAVTLGVIGTWTGLIAGATAALAGRIPAWLWWPWHKIAGIAFVLVWAHGVTAGADTSVFLSWYLGTGAAVLGAGVSRYTAHGAADVRAGVAEQARVGSRS